MNINSDFYSDKSDVFKAFLSSTNGKTQIGDFLFKFISQEMDTRSPNQRYISLLDIGCGPCTVERYTLPRIMAQYPKLKIKVTLIDSSSKLAQDVSSLSLEVPGPEYLFIQSPLEYIRSNHIIQEEHRYDWIICSHLLYYLDDWKSEIKRVFSWLTDTGVLFIVIRSKESPILKLQKFFSKVSDSYSTSDLVYGEDVVRYLNDIGIKFRFHTVSSSVSLPIMDVYNMPDRVCEIKENISNRALQIIMFYTHRELWSNITDNVLKDIKAYLIGKTIFDTVELQIKETYILANPQQELRIS